MASTHRFWVQTRMPECGLSNEWFLIHLNWTAHTTPRRAHELRVLNLMVDISRILRPVLNQARTLTIFVDQNIEGVCNCHPSLCPSGFWIDFSSVEVLRFVNQRVPLGPSPAASFLINCLCNDARKPLRCNTSSFELTIPPKNAPLQNLFLRFASYHLKKRI